MSKIIKGLLTKCIKFNFKHQSSFTLTNNINNEKKKIIIDKKRFIYFNKKLGYLFI